MSPECDIIVECERRKIAYGAEHTGHDTMDFFDVSFFDLAYQYESTFSFMEHQKGS